MLPSLHFPSGWLPEACSQVGYPAPGDTWRLVSGGRCGERSTASHLRRAGGRKAAECERGRAAPASARSTGEERWGLALLALRLRRATPTPAALPGNRGGGVPAPPHRASPAPAGSRVAPAPPPLPLPPRSLGSPGFAGARLGDLDLLRNRLGMRLGALRNLGECVALCRLFYVSGSGGAFSAAFGLWKESR